MAKSKQQKYKARRIDTKEWVEGHLFFDLDEENLKLRLMTKIGQEASVPVFVEVDKYEKID